MDDWDIWSFLANLTTTTSSRWRLFRSCCAIGAAPSGKFGGSGLGGPLCFGAGACRAGAGDGPVILGLNTGGGLPAAFDFVGNWADKYLGRSFILLALFLMLLNTTTTWNVSWSLCVCFVIRDGVLKVKGVHLPRWMKILFLACGPLQT